MATVFPPEALAIVVASLLQSAQYKTIQFGDRAHTTPDLSDLLTLLGAVNRSVTAPPTYRLAATYKGV